MRGKPAAHHWLVNPFIAATSTPRAALLRLALSLDQILMDRVMLEGDVQSPAT